MLDPIPRDFRSGFVALIGRPNVGKSTLINQLVGEKVAITSPVAQTTRNRLKAILTTPDSQLVMVDTPGIHKPHHLLGERLVKSAKMSIGEVDVVLLLLEACHLPGKGDLFIVNLLRAQKKPVLVALNKSDLIKDEDYLGIEAAYRSLLQDAAWPIYRCSALDGQGCKVLIEALAKTLPIGPQLYPSDTVSDQPEKVLLAELIREHSVAVKIDRLEEVPASTTPKKRRGYTAVLATVLVERKSQKGILIGKGGAMLKSIGQAARFQMQALIDGSVYLEIFVKVVPDWRSKPARLAELGYEVN